MGYTLVTSFDDCFYQEMNSVLKTQYTNKIPYGRKCDRNIADQAMQYHMTLVHWAKEFDGIDLPCIDQIRFFPFHIEVTGTNLMYAEEGSLLLYFSVIPGNNFPEAKKHLENTKGLNVPAFLHITLAVSQNHTFIQNIKR